LEHRRRIRLVLLRAIFILFLPGVSQQAMGQSVSDYQVKAAYLYSFAKFVEWPPRKFTDASSPIVFCIISDQAFQQELDRVVRGKSISGHTVAVMTMPEGEQLRRCHIVFINSAGSKQIRQTLETLRGSAVLTVGETTEFVKQGGIIRFLLEDDRVQFEVNHKSATGEGVYISARLLGVAKHVYE
jgi:hypothetical protein